MDFTSGKILPKLVKFMAPILLGLFLQALYGAVDLFVIGRFGSLEGISSISSGVQIMDLFIFLFAGFGSAVTILLGKYIGEKRPEKLKEVLGGALALFILLDIIFTLLIVIFAPSIATLLNVPIEAFDKNIQYVRICGGGLTCLVAYNLMSAIYFGLGDSKRPLTFIAIAAISNMILDFIFVALLKMDVAGAAIATVIAQLISVLFSIYFFKIHNKLVNFNIKEIKFNEESKNVFNIGLPVSIKETLTGISFIIILSFVNAMGLVEAQGYGVSGRIFNFIFILSGAIIQSMSSFIAQNYGAKKEDRCKEGLRKVILFSGSIGLVITLIATIFASQLCSIFTNDLAIIDQAAIQLQGFASEAFFCCILFSFSGYFSGHEKTRIVFIVDLICTFLVRIPFAYLVYKASWGNMLYMGISYPLSSLAGVLLYIIIYIIYQNKLKKSIINKI